MKAVVRYQHAPASAFSGRLLWSYCGVAKKFDLFGPLQVRVLRRRLKNSGTFVAHAGQSARMDEGPVRFGVDVKVRVPGWRSTRVAELAAERCTSCRGGEPTLDGPEVEELLRAVPDWRVVDRDGVECLEREFRFGDFASALEFTDRVGERAEEAGHHPALLTEWGKVTVTWWTHAIGGLHRNDFVMAARTDKVYASLSEDDGPGS
jgi:4a-hydroxytetrahydrobiopterin dehydratase